MIRDVLKVIGGTILVASFLPAFIKQKSWWVDGRAPNHQTADWRPDQRYSADVESALTLLAAVEPAEVRYLRSRGNPMSFLPQSITLWRPLHQTALSRLSHGLKANQPQSLSCSPMRSITQSVTTQSTRLPSIHF